MTPGKFIDCEQGSRMWAELRCGLVTASRISDVIAFIKKGEASDRANYRVELISERLTGQPYPQSAEHARQVQWGKEQEPFARAAYEEQKDILVDPGGFVIHPSVDRFGASPDGLVGEDGLMQIKCPTTKTHLKWMLDGRVPLEHAPQMLAEMACAGRAWCDFVSYDPRLPEHLQIYIRRFHADEKLILAIEAAVVHFNSEIDAVMKSLPPGPAPVVNLLDHADPEEMQF